MLYTKPPGRILVFLALIQSVKAHIQFAETFPCKIHSLKNILFWACWAIIHYWWVEGPILVLTNVNYQKRQYEYFFHSYVFNLLILINGTSLLCFVLHLSHTPSLLMGNLKAWFIPQEVFDRETHYPHSCSSFVQMACMVSLAKQLVRVIYEAVLFLEIVLIWLTSLL